MERNTEARAEKYARTAESLCSLINTGKEDVVPESTIEAWKTIFKTMDKADDYLDTSSSKELRDSFVKGSIAFLSGARPDFVTQDEELDIELKQLKLLVDSLPIQKKSFFLETLSDLTDITEQVRIESSPIRHAQLLNTEGQLTAELLLPFLPDNFLYSDNSDKILTVLTSLGRAGNVIDSVKDAHEDFLSGETTVKPSPINRGIFLAATLPDIARCIVNLPPKKTFEFGKRGISTITGRLAG